MQRLQRITHGVLCYRAAAPDSLAATTEHTGASCHTARRKLWRTL